MKLQLSDSNRTVITAISTNIDKGGDFDNIRCEYYLYLLINGLKLYYYGLNRDSQRSKDWNKLLAKGAIRVYHDSVFDEQEQGYFDGIKADNADPKKHGRIVYSILAGSQSGIFVWDYYKQKVVSINELSNI